MAQASGIDTVGCVTAPLDDPFEAVLNTAKPRDGGGGLTAQVMIYLML